ncbi:PG0870-related protein [Spirosoma flavum]|uniref:PG0870-related protein n=1 Tax=Spirosoma flavum TaxID=2048557 RepID=A0ABW6AT92_9BACT
MAKKAVGNLVGNKSIILPPCRPTRSAISGPKHRKTLSRYVDTQTGEPLPGKYGRCDQESNCGYHLKPYYKGEVFYPS